MIKARILTEWIGSPETTYRSKLFEDYLTQKCTDVTEQMFPFPINLLVVEVLMLENIFAQLEADPNYNGAVLWSETV